MLQVVGASLHRLSLLRCRARVPTPFCGRLRNRERAAGAVAICSVVRLTGLVTRAVPWTACEFRFRAARNSDRPSPIDADGRHVGRGCGMQVHCSVARVRFQQENATRSSTKARTLGPVERAHHQLCARRLDGRTCRAAREKPWWLSASPDRVPVVDVGDLPNLRQAGKLAAQPSRRLSAGPGRELKPAGAASQGAPALADCAMEPLWPRLRIALPSRR